MLSDFFTNIANDRLQLLNELAKSDSLDLVSGVADVGTANAELPFMLMLAFALLEPGTTPYLTISSANSS
jgi:hypothetical protein